MTAPLLATLGRSSLERSSRDRYVLRLQKLAHSLTRPCSLSSALVLGLVDLDPPAPIAERDLAACCVWLSEGGPVERPTRRPRGGDESPVGCLLDRRRSRDADFRLGERSWLCDPEDLRRVPDMSAECDERRLLPPLSCRGEGEPVSSPTSNISLPESSSSLSLKMPSKLGRSAEESALFFSAALPPTVPLLPLLLLCRRLSLLLRRLELVDGLVSSFTTRESLVGSKGTDVSFDRRPPSRRAALGVPVSSSTLASEQTRHNQTRKLVGWQQDMPLIPSRPHRFNSSRGPLHNFCQQRESDWVVKTPTESLIITEQAVLTFGRHVPMRALPVSLSLCRPAWGG